MRVITTFSSFFVATTLLVIQLPHFVQAQSCCTLYAPLPCDSTSQGCTGGCDTQSFPWANGSPHCNSAVCASRGGTWDSCPAAKNEDEDYEPIKSIGANGCCLYNATETKCEEYHCDGNLQEQLSEANCTAIGFTWNPQDGWCAKTDDSTSGVGTTSEPGDSTSGVGITTFSGIITITSAAAIVAIFV